jgi:hypothetical protein
MPKKRKANIPLIQNLQGRGDTCSLKQQKSMGADSDSNLSDVNEDMASNNDVVLPQDILEELGKEGLL